MMDQTRFRIETFLQYHQMESVRYNMEDLQKYKLRKKKLKLKNKKQKKTSRLSTSIWKTDNILYIKMRTIAIWAG